MFSIIPFQNQSLEYGMAICCSKPIILCADQSVNVQYHTFQNQSLARVTVVEKVQPVGCVCIGAQRTCSDCSPFYAFMKSLLVRVLDLWSKGCVFESRQERQENFFSRVNFVYWLWISIQCLFHPHVTAVPYKRPWSFCQKCGWQVTSNHAYTLDPTKLEWADYAAFQA